MGTRTRKIILRIFILFLFIISACTEKKEEEKPEPVVTTPVLITNVTVETLNASNKMFRNPKFSEDGSKLLFSSTVSSGLWLHDLQKDSTYQINSKSISAGDYTSDKAGNSAIFIHSSYDKELRKRNFYIGKQKLDSDSVENIYQSYRRLNQLKLTNDDKISFFERDSLIILDFRTLRKYDWGDKYINVLKASKGSIIEYSNGNKKRYTIIERGNVLWPQYVDENKFLFNEVGKGTFLFNRIDGTINHIGNYDQPVYCQKCNSIAFMNEKSDGHTVTSSRIFVMSLDGKKAVPVDPENSYVEENPSWSPDGKQLVYNTVEGKIQLARLEFTRHTSVND